MPATNVRVAYRPVRVGFLLRAGSLEDVHAAARLATLLWGGVYHPMIAVEDVDQGKRLISRFRPDVLHAIAADETLDAVVAAHPHLAWPRALEYFNGIAPHGGELPFLDVRTAISTMNSRGRLASWLRPTWADDEHAPLYAVLFGDYDLDDYVEWFLQGLIAGQMPVEGLPPGTGWTLTPLGATAYALEEPFTLGGIRSDGVVLGDATNADDLALFWNLRATGADVAFWPRQDLPALQAAAAAHVTRLLASPSQGLHKGIELWSTVEWPRDYSIPDKLADALGDCERVLARLDWETFRQPLNLPQSVATDESGVLGMLEDDGYGNARLSLALPPPPFQGGPELFHERLLVRVSFLVDSDPIHTLRLPFLPDLNDWYDHELTIVLDGVRVEVDATSVFIDPRDSSISLRLPKRDEVVRRVFARAGVTATPSAAGRATDVVAKQLGGLQGARVLRAPGVRALLRTPAWHNWETALAAITHGGLPDQRNQTAADVLTRLLECGALVAGLKLQCPNCRIRERYTLDQLGESMRCPRCRISFSPTPILHQSIWEYAASGFFADQGAHGAVPVLLAMMRLDQDTSTQRFIISSHDLHADGIDCESDLLVLEQHHDGRIAVGVSECKDGGEISQRDLDNLSAVGELLHASGIECYLIFATLRSEFTRIELDRFRGYVQSLEGQWSRDTSGLESWRRPAPILLTPRELEQWSFYPVEDRDGLPHEHVLGLRELAANSSARYLE